MHKTFKRKFKFISIGFFKLSVPLQNMWSVMFKKNFNKNLHIHTVTQLNNIFRKVLFLRICIFYTQCLNLGVLIIFLPPAEATGNV